MPPSKKILDFYNMSYCPLVTYYPKHIITEIRNQLKWKILKHTKSAPVMEQASYCFKFRQMCQWYIGKRLCIASKAQI